MSVFAQPWLGQSFGHKVEAGPYVLSRNGMMSLILTEITRPTVISVLYNS